MSGMCPGQDLFLSTYAAQWVTACLNYRELTGDPAVLTELFPAAERNIAAFEGQRPAGGVKDELGWAFVDWGYVRNTGPSDMGVNLHYLAALRDMRRWSEGSRPRRPGGLLPAAGRLRRRPDRRLLSSPARGRRRFLDPNRLSPRGARAAPRLLPRRGRAALRGVHQKAHAALLSQRSLRAAPERSGGEQSAAHHPVLLPLRDARIDRARGDGLRPRAVP